MVFHVHNNAGVHNFVRYVLNKKTRAAVIKECLKSKRVKFAANLDRFPLK